MCPSCYAPERLLSNTQNIEQFRHARDKIEHPAMSSAKAHRRQFLIRPLKVPGVDEKQQIHSATDRIVA
jgi:hypothetical protein